MFVSNYSEVMQEVFGIDLKSLLSKEGSGLGVTQQDLQQPIEPTSDIKSDEQPKSL